MTAPPGRLHAAAPPSPPPAPRRRRRTLRYVAATLFTLLAAVFALPDLLFGLDRRSPFVQLVSFRPWILVGGLALLALLLVVLLFERRVLPFVAGVVAVLLVGAAMVLPRAVADAAPTGGRALTVAAFNTFEGDAEVTEVAALIDAERPDVVALSEAGSSFRSRLAPLVEPMGYRLHTSTPPGRADVAGVTTVVAGGLGDVRVRFGEETPFPYVEVTGGGLGALRFVAFHSVAPVPGSVPQWRADLAQLAQWCAGPTPAVVAGDFNATLDHSALRSAMAGCGDAADQRGAGLVPTWGPTPRTRLIGPQIDHVIATDGIAAETFAVRDVNGSDHRAVLTRLRVPA
jgi:endonuclease/exonuclease/phosphatase (EEP) superfamily protein YafD